MPAAEDTTAGSDPIHTCLARWHTWLRSPSADMAGLKAAIVQAMDLKPERHWFDLGDEPQILRFMNATGG